MSTARSKSNNLRRFLFMKAKKRLKLVAAKNDIVKQVVYLQDTFDDV